MMKKTLSFVLLAAPVWAADLPVTPVPEPVFFEHRQDLPLPELSPDNAPSANKPSENAPVLTENELKQRPQLLEHLINQAVIDRRWDMLADLLALYRTLPAADTTLVRYAEGALMRSQNRHDEAVQRYRQIVAEHPDLDYVRLDLGLMLAEDKQYQEAAQELAVVAKADVAPPVRRLAEQVQKNLAETQSWQPSVDFQYAQTDNVNQASDRETIEWNGRQWRKTADSLPKSAHGFRYGVGVAREKNLGGHHFLYTHFNADGVHYWDNQDFNEQSLSAAAGYKWRNAAQTWGLVPFAEQNWLGGSRYNRLAGIKAEHSRRLSNRWQLALNGSFYQKRYRQHQTAERYDSNTLSTGATGIYQVSPDWAVYGGADWSGENTRERELASDRYGLRIGSAKTFANGLGLRANLHYARRLFKKEGSLVYLFKRQDNEYLADASLWHKALSYKGLTPKLNLRYLRIDSNMPGFYSRKSLQGFVSVEKAF